MADWLSNITSSAKTLVDAGLSKFKTPSQSNNIVRTRISAASTPSSNFSNRIKTSFDNNLAKFRQQKADTQQRVKTTAKNWASSFDVDKTKPGFQLIPGGWSGGVNRVKTSLQRPDQYNVFRQVAKIPMGQTAQKINDFSRNLERSPFGLPGRMVKNVGTGVAYAATNELKNTGRNALEYIKSPIYLAQKLGEAAAMPGITKLREQTADLNQKQASLYLQKAIEFTKAGDREKAKQFFNASKEALNRTTLDTNQQLADLEASKQKLQESGIKTANLVGMVANPMAAAKTMAVGGTLNSMIKAAMNESNPRDFLEGMEAASDYAGFVNITNPIIAGVVGKVASQFNNPVAQNLIARTLSAVGNLLEDRGIDKVYNQERSVYDDLFSLGIGFIMQSGGDIKDYDNLKKELSTFGLSKQDADAVAESFQKAKSRLTYETKYQETMNGKVTPKAVLASETTAPGVGREYDRLLTREEAIKAGYDVLKPEEEARLKAQKTQGGFIGTKVEEPEIGKAENKFIIGESLPKGDLYKSAITTKNLDEFLSKYKETPTRKVENLPFEGDVQTLTKFYNDATEYNNLKNSSQAIIEKINAGSNITQEEAKIISQIYPDQYQKLVELNKIEQPEVQPGIQEPVVEPRNLDETLATQPNSIAPDINAETAMNNALKTGSTQDIVEGTKPVPQEQTAADILSQQMKDFQEQQKILKESAQNIEPQQSPLAEEAMKAVFGEEKIDGKTIEIPEDIQANQKLRKTYLSMMESPVYGEDYKANLQNHEQRFYIPKTEKEGIATALRDIEENGLTNTAINFVNNGINLNDSQNIITALVTHQSLVDAGEIKLAESLAKNIMLQGTTLGQSVNAYKILDYASPSMVRQHAVGYVEGGLQNNTITSKILKFAGLNDPKLTDMNNVYKESRGFLDKVRQDLPKIADPEGKKEAIVKLLEDNKILNDKIKDKGLFADQILKDFTGETKIDEISAKFNEDTGVKLSPAETEYYIKQSNAVNKIENPEEKQAFKKQLNDELATKTTKKISQRLSLIDKLSEIGQDQRSSLFPELFEEEVKNSLMKELELPHVDAEFSKYILDESFRIKQIADGKEKQKATRELFKKINQKIPPTFQELFRAYTYNNVLMGFGTHLRNGFENLTSAFIYTPLELLGSHGLDIPKGFSDAKTYLQFMVNEFPNAIKNTKEALVGNIFPDKMNMSSERSQIIPEWLKISGRVLEASDQLSFTGIKKGIEAVNLKNGMDPVEASIKASNRANQILYKGGYDTKNETGQGLLLTEVDKIGQKAENFLRGSGLDYFVMFPRIIIKLAKTRYEYSPLGLTNMKGSDNPRIQATKALIGSVSMISGFVAAATGHTRGAAPTDKEERTAFYEEGPEWTTDLAGFNVPIKYLGKADLSYKMGIWLYDNFVKKGNPAFADAGLAERAAIAGFGLLSMYLDETYATDVVNVLDAINDMAKGDSYAMSKMLGSSAEKLMPFSGAAAWINQTFIDPVKRSGKGFFENMVRRMPILSQGVDAYKTTTGEDADVGYGDPTLKKLNPLLPYNISRINPELREMIDESRAGRYENKIIKLEEKELEPTYWEKLSGVSASGEDFTDITEVPSIKSTGGLDDSMVTETSKEEEGGWLSNLFGKKDKKATKIYNPGEIIIESSNDKMDVIALSNDKTFKIPKETEAFNQKYKNVAKAIETYDEKRNAILYDDKLGPVAQQKKLRELDAVANPAKEINAILEAKYPEQVFGAQIESYGKGSNLGVDTRGEWAVTKLAALLSSGKKQNGTEWQSYVNKMWEGGVLTGKATGTLAYILEENPGLTASDFKYTGDDVKVAKIANSATGSGGKKKNYIQAKTIAPPQTGSSQLTLKMPEYTPISNTRLSFKGNGLPARPSTEYLRVKAPDLENIPKLKINRQRILGL